MLLKLKDKKCVAVIGSCLDKVYGNPYSLDQVRHASSRTVGMAETEEAAQPCGGLTTELHSDSPACSKPWVIFPSRREVPDWSPHVLHLKKKFS